MPPAGLTLSSTLHLGPRLSPSGSAARRWIIPLLLVAAALATALALPSQPDHISDVALTGPRGPACERIIMANDTSGSMSEYTIAREAALTQFLQWAPANLRADDEVGVIDFSGHAEWSRTPTRIGEPAVLIHTTPADSTALTPIIELLAALTGSTCDTTLVLLSDAQYPDIPRPDDARALLTRADLHDIVLLVPDPDINVPTEWTQAFPTAPPIRFDGTNPDATALAIAEVTATITGQQLTRN